MNNASPVAPPVAGAGKTVSQMLGEIVWLMSQSPIHKQMAIGDLEWFCMPALLVEQYRIYYGNGAPAAVALWANLTGEAEKRLLAGEYKLAPDEWAAGDRRWLIELVSPFGGQDEALADLADQVFQGQPFKFHSIGYDGKRTVSTYPLAPAVV